MAVLLWLLLQHHMLVLFIVLFPVLLSLLVFECATLLQEQHPAHERPMSKCPVYAAWRVLLVKHPIPEEPLGQCLSNSSV